VDLSSSLKKLTTQKYQLTSRERIMVIALMGILVFFISTYLIPTEEVPPMFPQVKSENTTPKKVIPVNQVAQANPSQPIMRDPFALPPDDRVPPPGTSKTDLPVLQNNVPSMVPKNTGNMTPETMLLTGTIGNGDQLLAVIMHSGKSRSYSRNEFIGAYQLTEIQKEYVVLRNAASRLVLHLEPSKQKEGKRSEK